MGEKYTKTIQITIAVLAALVSLCLTVLIGTLTHRQLYQQVAPPADTPGDPAISAAQIVLSGSQAEDTSDFSTDDLFPGDHQTQYYNVQVTYRDQLSLCLDSSIRSDNKLTDVMKVCIRLPSTGEQLYDGPAKEMSCITYDLNSTGKVTEDICYEVTFYLDPSVNNDYQNMDFNVDFNWWAEDPDVLRPPFRSDVIKVLLCVALAVTAGLVAVVLIEEYTDKEDKRHG